MVTQNHFSEIFSTLYKFREEGFMCDTVILAEDKRMKAHGLLLAAASPVFKSAFEEDDRPGQHFVNLSHVDSVVMEIALHFIYTGKLLLPHVYTQTNELPKLFAALHLLGLEPQKLNGCEMRFKSREEEPSDHLTPLDGQEAHNGNPVYDQQMLYNVEIEESVEDVPDAAIPKVDFPVLDSSEHQPIDLDILTELANGNAVAESLSCAGGKEAEEMEERAAEETPPTVTLGRRRGSGPKRRGSAKNSLRTKGQQRHLQSISDRTSRANKSANNDRDEEMVSLLTGMKCGRVKAEPSRQEDSTDFDGDNACLLRSDCIKEEVAAETIEAGDTRRNNDPNDEMILFLISSKNSSKGDETRVPRSKPLKKLECFICGKICKTRSKLEQHLLIHTGEKPHLCPYCSKGFANKSNLERHVKMHTGVRPHLCDLCGKGFIQKTSLLDHMLIHYEAKAYKCTVCGLSYNRKTNLHQHFARLHQSKAGADDGGNAAGYDAKRPFLCDLCGRGFATVVTLKFHKKLHTGEKPFACGVCDKGFVQKTQLDQHFRIHTGVKPYICQTCGKAFVYKDSLTQHMRIHTGEKPYVCQVCSKAYTQSHHLKGHMLTHTGEKPYACQLCNKAYKNRADLRFHSARVHQISLPKLSKNNF